MNLQIISAFLPFAFVLVTHAAMPPSFRTGRVSLQIDSEYFWTQSNYNIEGESIDLPTNQSYKNLSNTLSGTYFLPQGWATSGGFGYAYVSSESFENRTNGALTQLFARAQKLFAFSIFRLIPEVEVTATLDPIEEDQDDVLTHEGANTAKVGSWLTIDISRLRIYGFAGYEYRDGGRASLIPWNAGVGFRAAKWQFFAEANGAEVFEDDTHVGNRIERVQVTNRVSAGSLRYYSVNPQWIEARVQAGYEIQYNTLLSLGYGQTIMGKNTADGRSLFLTLTYNIDSQLMSPGLEESSEYENTKKPLKDLKSVDEEFEPEIEQDYDESLFEEDL
jgi:hypothetical protein